MKKTFTFIVKYIYAFLASVYLFGLGFLFAKNRTLILAICRHFGYEPMRQKLLIPGIKISDVLDKNISICLDELEVCAGNVAHIELICLANIVKQAQPLRAFEIGTFNGISTLNIAINCPQETEVYTLDLPKNLLTDVKLSLTQADKAYINKEESGSKFHGKDCEKKIIQLYGDSATFDFSEFFGTMDFVFVDGSHSYEYTLNDSLVALKLLRKRSSVIVWHDYGGSWEGVVKALNEVYLKGDLLFKKLRHIRGTSLVCLLNKE